MSQAETRVAPPGPKQAALDSAALALWTRALRVRWLAGEIMDRTTSDRLLDYAAELEARAMSADSQMAAEGG
jgi:hypothetical protein